MVTIGIAFCLAFAGSALAGFALAQRGVDKKLQEQGARLAKAELDAVQPAGRSKVHLGYIAGPSGSGKSTFEAWWSWPTATAGQLRTIIATRCEKLGREIPLVTELTDDGDIQHKLRYWDSAGESPGTAMNAVMMGTAQAGEGERAVAIWILNLADVTANHRYFTRETVDLLWGNHAARRQFRKFVVVLNKEDVVRELMDGYAVDRLIEAECTYVRDLLMRVLGGGCEIEFTCASALNGQGMREAWGAVLRALDLGHLYDSPAGGPTGGPSAGAGVAA